MSINLNDRDQVIKILEQITHRIYVSDPSLSELLKPWLSEAIGFNTVGIGYEAEFLRVATPEEKRKTIFFSGPCADTDGLFKQTELLEKIWANKELRQIISDTVDGGTLWSYMLSKQLIFGSPSDPSQRKRLFGVMPKKGIPDIQSIINQLPTNLPKYDALAIVGENYGEQINVWRKIAMGNKQSCLIIFGGNEGAFLEANKFQQNTGRYVLCYDTTNSLFPINDKLLGQNIIRFTNPDTLINFLLSNVFNPDSEFCGEHVGYQKFIEYLDDTQKVPFSFVSNSDSFIDHRLVMEILNFLFNIIFTGDLSEYVISLAGGTAYGGIKADYIVSELFALKTAGIICEKGFKHVWSKVQNMIHSKDTGINWTEESKAFLEITRRGLLFGLGGGPQSKNEILTAAKMGIPVFCIHDKRIRGATLDLRIESQTDLESEAANKNINYYSSSKEDLIQAALKMRKILLAKIIK